MKTQFQQKYATITSLCDIFGCSRYTIWRWLNVMREVGAYNDIVLETGPRKRFIDIAKFELFFKNHGNPAVERCTRRRKRS